MSKSSFFENKILRHIFLNEDIATGGPGDPFLRGGLAAGSFAIALYTSPGPGEAGPSNTNEATYTGYSRILVPRTTAGWSINTTDDIVTNAAKITFPACTGGSNTITHFAICTNVSPTTDSNMLFYGQLTTPLNVSVGITPEFNVGTLTITEQ